MLTETIKERIAFFRQRVEDDGYDYCFSLFESLTIKLMACKYAYYICNNPFIEDMAYDMDEKSWYIMGRALDCLEPDEISPCIDFDESHAYAAQGIELAKRLMRK